VGDDQNFVNIPYDRFKRKLKSKCDEYGIEYIEVDGKYKWGDKHFEESSW